MTEPRRDARWAVFAASMAALILGWAWASLALHLYDPGPAVGSAGHILGAFMFGLSVQLLPVIAAAALAGLSRLARGALPWRTTTIALSIMWTVAQVFILAIRAGH